MHIADDSSTTNPVIWHNILQVVLPVSVLLNLTPSIMDPPTIRSNDITSSALTQVIPSLPCGSQSLSRLLQLPAELRLMVLRDLLVQSTPIDMRESYDHPYIVHNKGRERDARGRFVKQTWKAIVSGYRLTPSIISTCQHLFHEALPVLYLENNLRIDIQMYWNQRAHNLGLPQPNGVHILLSPLDSSEILRLNGQSTTLNDTLI